MRVSGSCCTVSPRSHSQTRRSSGATCSRSRATSPIRPLSSLREAAARIPADRILAETDCPYLAPVPFRGKPNRPANVMTTLARLAEVRGVTTAELGGQIERNAERLFGL